MNPQLDSLGEDSLQQEDDEMWDATVREEEAQELENEILGARLPEERAQGVTHLGIINVNTLKPAKWQSKNDEIFSTLKKHKFNIIGITEPNLQWHNLKNNNRWRSRIIQSISRYIDIDSPILRLSQTEEDNQTVN